MEKFLEKYPHLVKKATCLEPNIMEMFSLWKHFILTV